MRFPPWMVVLISCTPKPEAEEDDSGQSASFEGTSTRAIVIDGVEACSESYELVGTPYEGDCPDCLFAFALEATALQGSGQCPPDARLTWAEDGNHQGIRLALSESHEVLWGTSSPLYTYYGGTAPPEGWVAVGQGSWDGETLKLHTEHRGEQYENNPDLFQECGAFGYLTLTAPGPTADTPGSVGCNLTTFDVWELQAEQGAVISLWVDNVAGGAPEEVLNPVLGLTDAETCLLGVGSPSFPCASSPGPEPLQCPGLEMTAPATGTYRVIIADQEGPCQEGSAGYVLRGNLDGTPLTFSQTVDDADIGQRILFEEQASLVARVQP